MRELFALPRLVFVRPYGACTRTRYVGAAALLGGAHDVCTASAGAADVLAVLSRVKHNRSFCRVHSLFALPRLIFVRSYGVCVRS